MFCWHRFHAESERVEEDSFNSIAASFIAGNNITYQFEVQEMLYEAKNAACKPSILSKEGNLQTHADNSKQHLSQSSGNINIQG